MQIAKFEEIVDQVVETIWLAIPSLGLVIARFFVCWITVTDFVKEEDESMVLINNLI